MGASASRYRVGSLIGEGGMGRVFLAEDRELGRKVALKFLPDEAEADPKVRERFRLEARAAAALDHPFICKVYEIGESEGKTFIAMEFVPGDTLRELLTRGPLPRHEALVS